jgi:hypothetical protein
MHGTDDRRSGRRRYRTYAASDGAGEEHHVRQWGEPECLDGRYAVLTTETVLRDGERLRVGDVYVPNDVHEREWAAYNRGARFVTEIA